MDTGCGAMLLSFKINIRFLLTTPGIFPLRHTNKKLIYGFFSRTAQLLAKAIGLLKLDYSDIHLALLFTIVAIYIFGF